MQCPATPSKLFSDPPGVRDPQFGKHCSIVINFSLLSLTLVACLLVGDRMGFATKMEVQWNLRDPYSGTVSGNL